MSKSKLYEKSMIVLGYLICLWVVYRLFVIERVGYIIDHRVSYLRLCIGVTIVMSQVFVMVMIINKLRKKELTRISKLVSKVIERIYYQPLKSFATVLLQNEVVAIFTKLMSKILVQVVQSKTSAYFFTVYFYLVPKFILVIVLWADIIILNQIYTFYKMIWLLGVTIIIQGVVGLINIHTTTLKTELEDKYLNKELSTAEQIVLITRDCEIETEWIQYYNIVDTIKAINLVKISKLYLVIDLCITMLFLGAWIIYVYKIVLEYAKLCVKYLLRCYQIF
jgi:hypothetical protein